MKDSFSIYWFSYHIFQVLVFQLYASKRLSKFSYIMAYKRNPEIAKNFLPTVKQLHHSFWDYSIAIFCIFFLATGFFQENSKFYWTGKYLSLYGFLFTTLVLDLYKYHKLKKQIPLKDKRSASLTTRTIGKIIPTWLWVLYFIICTLVIISFKDSAKGIILGAVVIFLAYLSIEKRAKLPMANEDDQLYRIMEGKTVFAIAWTFPLVFPLKNYLGHNSIDAIFSTLPLLFFIIFLNSKIYKRLTTN